MPSPSPFRPEFEAALRLLAFGSVAMDAVRHQPPVLVGDGAVEVYTRGAVTTGARIAALKAALGIPHPPRNAGANRTASKRALLKAIEEAGGDW